MQKQAGSGHALAAIGKALPLLASLAVAQATHSEDLSRIYPLYDGNTGVTCADWNLDGKLPWRNRGGDWIDAGPTPQPQGPSPAAKTLVGPTGKFAPVKLDVTPLVQG